MCMCVCVCVFVFICLPNSAQPSVLCNMARRVYCCVLLTTGPDGNDDSRPLSSAVVNRCNLTPSLICQPPLVFPHFRQVFVKTTLSSFLHHAAVMLSELVFLDFQCVARNHQTSLLSP